MFIVNEKDKEYRFGDNGPKYLMRGPRMSFGILQLKPGQEFTAHYHSVMEENFYVLEGRIKFIINGVSYILGSGELIHTEPGEVHHLINTGEGYARVIISLAPYMDNDKVEVED
ncbi:MAG: cupin domain-containing protein [Flexilinea sp.]